MCNCTYRIVIYNENLNEKIFFILLLALTSCDLNLKKSNQLDWNKIEIVDFKMVESNALGIKSSIKWPVLNDEIRQFNDQEVIIEGYLLCLESMNLETLKPEMVCLITNQREPTIEVCGVPQFRQNEFIKIEDTLIMHEYRQIKLKGILRINEDGANNSLLRICNVKVIE